MKDGSGGGSKGTKKEKEHTKNARPSTEEKHQKGRKRVKTQKRGGEAGDARRPYDRSENRDKPGKKNKPKGKPWKWKEPSGLLIPQNIIDGVLMQSLVTRYPGGSEQWATENPQQDGETDRDYQMRNPFYM